MWINTNCGQTHRYHNYQGSNIVGGCNDAGLGGLEVESALDAGDHHVDQPVDANALHRRSQREEDEEPLGAPEPVEEGKREAAGGAISHHDSGVGRGFRLWSSSSLKLEGARGRGWAIIITLHEEKID